MRWQVLVELNHTRSWSYFVSGIRLQVLAFISPWSDFSFIDYRLVDIQVQLKRSSEEFSKRERELLEQVQSL